jgi:hypothetical protein
LRPAELQNNKLKTPFIHLQSKGSNDQTEEASSGSTELDMGSRVGGLLSEARGAGGSSI